MTAPLRVLIADDELMARRRLRRLLEGLPEVEVCAECADGPQVLREAATSEADVLLLDIQMSGLDGVETVRRLGPGGPTVIFCTAHSEHAVDAFEVGAVDYLLKPIDAPRLEKALERVRSRLALRKFRDQQARQRKPAELRRLPISTRQGIVLVDPLTISHALLDGELVTIATSQGDYLTDSPLQELEERLPATFMRVHRRALLNLEKVVRLEPADTGGFVARTERGDGVQVSRQAARELRRMLGLRAAPDSEDSVGGAAERPTKSSAKDEREE
ncbi:MAG: LytTR family DNA-binding domain-containing protein [Myxococcales bacterium]